MMQYTDAQSYKTTLLNIPNTITLARIVLIPIFVLVFFLPFKGSHITAAFFFALAAATDWLDGHLARLWKQVSPFGAFLDPVADKLIVAVALVLIVGDNSLPYLAIPAAIIVGREIVISALREWMAEMGKRASVAVSYVGKLKTSVQMIALVILIAYRPHETPFLGLIGYILLCFAALLTLWSMTMYIKAAWPELVSHSS